MTASSGYRSYTLSISGGRDARTILTVMSWDLANSHYPTIVERTVLQGVPFPAHRDAVWALGRALDTLAREVQD